MMTAMIVGFLIGFLFTLAFLHLWDNYDE